MVPKLFIMMIGTLLRLYHGFFQRKKQLHFQRLALQNHTLLIGVSQAHLKILSTRKLTVELILTNMARIINMV